MVAPTASNCPSAARPLAPSADLRPPVGQHAAGFEFEDRDPRRRQLGVVDGEPTALVIERQVIRREIKREPPDDPALTSVPNANAPLERFQNSEPASIGEECMDSSCRLGRLPSSSRRCTCHTRSSQPSPPRL